MSSSARESPMDFWSYLAAAPGLIRTRAPGADVDATRLLLTLNRASGAITNDLESTVLKAYGLTWSAFRVLHPVWLVGALEPRELAHVTGMSRALISATMKNLLGRGLIERSTSAQDARVATLTLTQAGSKLIEEVFREQNQRERQWASALTRKQRETLQELLLTLAGHAPGP